MAELLFPNVTGTREELSKRYPKRDLKEGAKVTRFAPSPTGFIHFGGLFPVMTCDMLSKQSGGIFFLRIEDTDKKREVEGGVHNIIDTFAQYEIYFDEGATVEGDNGSYGPYRQSQRADIYHVFAKWMVLQGKAYPCFCTEEELSAMRKTQEEQKANFGYYGKWAAHRDMSLEDIKAKLESGVPYVLRLKSQGDISRKINHNDLIKGKMELPENDQDIVLLKSDGIPTYHFAHVIDDFLMGTTHVTRGDEWLATLPVHLQLFKELELKTPKYMHISPLMKMEGTSKRKLSKRHDPESAMTFYSKEGYPVGSVKEYVMTLLNSDFEDWRRQNPQSPLSDFPFSLNKMSASGALFDLVKLADVSKQVISRMTAQEVYDKASEWMKEYATDFYPLFTRDKDYTLKILSIGRGGAKPRRDIAIWSDLPEYMGFFFDEKFAPEYTLLPQFSKEEGACILEEYKAIYSEQDDQGVWFDKIKELAVKFGYAGETKAYKQNPESYKGHVGDISSLLRIAVTGKESSPDMWSVMSILGGDKVIQRLDKMKNAIK